jgi:lambda repressor-like predicted transcriptional regulator
MARTTRRNAPPRHVAVIEAILQERGWSVTTLATRSKATGRGDLAVSPNTLYRVLRGAVPSWPLQAEIAAALSIPDQSEDIGATQLFGERPLPNWVLELIGMPTTATAVAA